MHPTEYSHPSKHLFPQNTLNTVRLDKVHTVSIMPSTIELLQILYKNLSDTPQTVSWIPLVLALGQHNWYQLKELNTIKSIWPVKIKDQIIYTIIITYSISYLLLFYHNVVQYRIDPLGFQYSILKYLMLLIITVSVAIAA